MRKQQHYILRGLFALAILTLLYYLAMRQQSGTTPPVPAAPTQSAGRVPTQRPGGAAPTPGAGTTQPGQPGELPQMAQKPQPKEITFQGCPPEGDGGDAALNRLKNRVDEGSYAPVSFDAVAKLAWPPTIERKQRADWSQRDAGQVAQYEGIPIVVEGYLAGAKLEGPESPNCHGADPQFRDFHVWMTKTAGADRSQSVVVETTPRVRANHPGWTVDALTRIARAGQRVRISGWLMLDPEHPDQVGNTRGTIWEIHPIMQIDVQQGGAWVSLDSLASR